MKKLFCEADIFVILFDGLAFLSLFLPLFVTTVAGTGEGTTLSVAGLEMISFSPWGYVVGFIPTTLLMVMKFHKKITHKYPLVLLLIFAGLFAHNAGLLAAREWICGIADGFVRTMGGNLLLYPAFLVSAGFMLMLFMYDEDNFDEDDWYDDDEDEWDPVTEEAEKETAA